MNALRIPACLSASCLIALGTVGTTASIFMLARSGQTDLEAPISATSAATLG